MAQKPSGLLAENVNAQYSLNLKNNFKLILGETVGGHLKFTQKSESKNDTIELLEY